MKNLTNLFKLIELTRAQPQYGYAAKGVMQHELSNLAEHQYMVTFIAWQLAINLKSAGSAIDPLKVVEFALVHDLGELFGGDIGMYYAKANPAARELAKAFEVENQRFISTYFGEQKEHFFELSKEILQADSDEALIAKVADYLEVTHYKVYIGKFEQADFELIQPKMQFMVNAIKDNIAKDKLETFLESWLEDLNKFTLDQILGNQM